MEKVIYSAQADRSLNEINYWFALVIGDPTLAEKILTHIQSYAQQLLYAPLIGAKLPYWPQYLYDIRGLVVSKYSNYKVIYTYNLGQITVLDVWDTRMDLQTLIQRVADNL